jgi:hypothetical protein
MKPMKHLFITILSFVCSSAAFSQDGFFLQPEIGVGMANTCWRAFSPAGLPGQESVLSYQGQLDLGYRSGKWQFISGLGYLRTGVTLKQGSVFDFTDGGGPVFFYDNSTFLPYLPPMGVTVYNPHIILPIKVGYEICRFSNKLSLNPVAGAEFFYNMRRTIISKDNWLNQNGVESLESFQSSCNRFSVAGLLQLNMEYKFSKRIDLTGGPSVHYMFTSMLNFRSEYDYAVLLNLGFRWNFRHKAGNDNIANAPATTEPVINN